MPVLPMVEPDSLVSDTRDRSTRDRSTRVDSIAETQGIAAQGVADTLIDGDSSEDDALSAHILRFPQDEDPANDHADWEPRIVQRGGKDWILFKKRRVTVTENNGRRVITTTTTTDHMPMSFFTLIHAYLHRQ